jgi:RND family efflux transporter MFP subunit
MTRYGKLAGIGAMALLLTGGLLYGTWKADQADAARPDRPSAIPVEVARVTMGSLTSGVSAVGTVEARRDVVVSAEAPGRIVRVCVEVGDRVAQGTVLAEVDAEFRRLAVEQAQAQRALAGANARKTAKDLDRNRALFEKGDVSDAEMEGLRLAAQNAESALRSAEVALKVAGRQLADTQVRSPIAGVVAKRSVEVGETVGPGTPVADVVDLDVVKVTLSVPEQEIGRIAPGQTARVTLDPYPGVTVEGSVVSVGSKAEKDSHRYPVEVEVANRPDALLKSGMFARTEILTGTREQVPLIPVSALLEDAVYVVRDGRAHLRPVSPGERQGDTVAVLKGLREGDQVVTIGQQMLRDGAAVEVAP